MPTYCIKSIASAWRFVNGGPSLISNDGYRERSLTLKYIRPVISLLDHANEAVARCGAELTSAAYNCNLPLGKQKVTIITLARDVPSRACNYIRRVVTLLLQQVVMHVVFDHLRNSASALEFGC